MNTLTKEWLQNTITSIESARDEIPFGLNEDQNNMLTALKIALTSLEAEPVAWKATFTQIDNEYNTFTTMYSDKAEVERWVRLHEIGDFRAEITPLYAAPSAPVIPDGWISCSERMPDDGQHVIILCDGAFVLYAQYRDGEFFDIVRNGDEFFETQSRNVTDWMPLPEPPEQDGE
ncbi:DUF551 domain-containing protein [Escherichia coli]|uniref:DUF551 domain-containing protein n=1 Tax=Escherichia coli TaxID=562 RepID=UPI0002A1D2E4|nr:DUF551 domain-containing protein [Escherichia coli]EKK2501510.1 DUF551 domain-containing protein [Escherichia coli O142]EKC4267958.1 DUF551 domain-containing protein [Escherichia coli]EKH3652523.1 DUF551 domain-containing protein [Escherichia coli]EKH3757270.1 DUF551 domain-containing protein [Escherichia coli]EKH4084907.1 DUF551 domain-containing protein [Escherichia coli]